MKRVESPGLLAFLQTLDKPQASAGTIAGAASAENKMAENRCEELEKARTELTASADREKARAEAASAALEVERSALAASEAKLTKRRTRWNGSGDGRRRPRPPLRPPTGKSRSSAPARTRLAS